MNVRLKKILLLLLAGALLASTSWLQTSLNHHRDALGLTRVQPLTNAPPVLAFTTVALGGFRGLISNLLWIRASELQEQDKFFEMAQLADWITKLEPHFAQVWAHHAWNMTYNISVKFKQTEPGQFPDRWRWVKAGIELLRDEGLVYNPHDVLLYRELAWFFQHKMGQNLDDGHMYYKQTWANEMAEVFDEKRPNLDELINPQTDDAKRRATLLREKYKMDPRFMKELDERDGPLDWRLPEAHAIYWASKGLEQAAKNPSKVKQDDLLMLRRVVYQSMQLSFQRGRLIVNPFEKVFEFGPNIDIVPRLNAAYERAMQEDVPNREHISRGHRNFLRDAVYFLYIHNRLADADKWFRYLGEKYPDKNLLEDNDSLPGTVSLEQYAFGRIQVDVKETSGPRIRSILEGLLINSYNSLVLDEEERAVGLKLLALKVYEAYQSEMGDLIRTTLPPFADIDRDVLRQILDTENGFPPQVRAVLRTKLGLPAEEAPAPEAAPVPVPPAANPS